MFVHICPRIQSSSTYFTLSNMLNRVMSNQQLVRHTATVLRRWREGTNISASMKTFYCYDIDNSMVLIRHHWLELNLIDKPRCGKLLWKCVDCSRILWHEKSAKKPQQTWEVNKSHSNQIALKTFGSTKWLHFPKIFWGNAPLAPLATPMSTRTDLALNEQRRLNASVYNAKVIYAFHWRFLQLPTILVVSILDWITVCIVDVCISYKTINFLIKPLNKQLISHFSLALLYFTFFQI